MEKYPWKYGASDAHYSNAIELIAQIQPAIESLQLQQRRGVDWMRGHIDRLGQAAGADTWNSFYRVPWALAIAGERVVAARVLGWVEDNVLTERHDLSPGPARKPNPPYALAQLAIGAWHLEQYRLAASLMENLIDQYQNPESGGCQTQPRSDRQLDKADVMLTAQLGMAALCTGQEACAKAAARWFETLWEAQPALPKVLFTSTTSEGLVVDRNPRDAWGTFVDFSAIRQQYYQPAIAAAFLGRFGQRYDSARHLQLAEQFLALNARGGIMQWDHHSVQICKFSWGASVLFECNGRARNLEQILLMADWFRDEQASDGAWRPSPFQAAEPTPSDCMPKTAEHVLHVTTMLTALGRVARQGCWNDRA